ncbi:unnamed protein product, partial [Ectocarpus sp. 8 AP-2014]
STIILVLPPCAKINDFCFSRCLPTGLVCLVCIVWCSGDCVQNQSNCSYGPSRPMYGVTSMSRCATAAAVQDKSRNSSKIPGLCLMPSYDHMHILAYHTYQTW